MKQYSEAECLYLILEGVVKEAAAAFFCLDPSMVYIGDGEDIAYPDGLGLQEEMRYVQKEDPAFDPTEFKLTLYDVVPPMAEAQP